MHKTPERSVITGMGAISPVGNSVAETWANLKGGRSGLRRVTMFDPWLWPCQVGGDVKKFDPGDLIGTGVVLGTAGGGLHRRNREGDHFPDKK
jgi:3-oxoacyl-(acyl-carrier-protein) synthase